MDRREALHHLSVLVGGTISTPTMAAILSGCRAGPPSADWTPSVLSSSQLELLELVVDRIVPPTDTPGATEVGVPAFIDSLLDGWVDADERDRFLTGLATIDEAANAAYGGSFGEASVEQQDALLGRLDQEALAAPNAPGTSRPFFSTLKELTLVGYYTSEAGATQELQWLAAPGRYDGDLPVEEVGRTWA